MALPPILNRLGDFVFRTAALREARARVGRPSEGYVRAVDQVKMVVEVARRVAEPVEALPRGSRPAVLLPLYRDAVYWALGAEFVRHDPAGVLPSDLGTLWAGADAARLANAAGGEAALSRLHDVLVEWKAAQLLDASDDDVSRARTFAENLLWELDTPARTVERLQVQRWTRVAAVVLVVLVGGYALRAALRGPNLVAARVFKTSSSLPECSPPNKCGEIFFHTQAQDQPWIDFDLGAVKKVRQVELRNRADCCSDRAVPLVVEVSTDDQNWTQVARRDTDFTTWSTSFTPRQARFVRLRVARASSLHLEDVQVR